MNALDGASAAATQLITAQRSGKPLAPTTLTHYEQQFAALTTQREHMRTVIARWWTLLEDRAQLMTRDDGYTPFSGRRSGPPSPILVQRLWRVQKAQSGNVLSCGLYLHPRGIEARCGYGNEEDLLMSQVEGTPDAAREIAEAWRSAVLAKGFKESMEQQR